MKTIDILVRNMVDILSRSVDDIVEVMEKMEGQRNDKNERPYSMLDFIKDLEAHNVTKERAPEHTLCDGCGNQDTSCNCDCATEFIEKEDVVNEPNHYQHGTFEVIDEMLIVFGVEATLTFCKMNAWKYRARAPYKGTFQQDMDKANRYIEMAYQIQQIRQEYPEADGYEVSFLLKGKSK